MDDKGKYLLSLGFGALLGSAATLATSKLLLRFVNSTDKTANYIEVLGIHLKGINFARLSPFVAPSATVVVKGPPQKITEEDLYQILAEWGPIRHIRVIKERRYGISRGFAFVDFPSVGAAQIMMDRFGHEGLIVYDSKLFFEYRVVDLEETDESSKEKLILKKGILGVAGGLFQLHLGEKMLLKPNFRMLPCSDRGCSGCYEAVEETIVGCCLEMDLSGRVGYSSASQAGASTVKVML
ncbi:hypothetical protein OROHE_005478 [Orobanche hederae]